MRNSNGRSCGQDQYMFPLEGGAGEKSWSTYQEHPRHLSLRLDRVEISPDLLVAFTMMRSSPMQVIDPKDVVGKPLERCSLPDLGDQWKKESRLTTGY